MSSRRTNFKEPELTSETNEPIFKASREVSRVAIIGRPNVGKSTLFNYLTDSRKAVVKNQPGVTRDIIIEPGEIWGHKFDVIDTGGLTEATDLFSKLIREQVVDFLKSVDHLILVMDGRLGVHAEDRDIIRVAKEAGKPFLLVINKVDSIKDSEISKAEFYEFGVDIVSASFEQRYGMDEILEWIVAQVQRTENTVREGLTLAMVGKPNVGKSSLCNRLLGEKRLLVSEVAGTTTDSIDTELLYEGRKFVLIDTAGLRRSARLEEGLEIISTFKTRDAIRRADVTLLVVDGNEGPTSQDAKILEQILRSHRAVLLVANKVDIAEENHEAYRSWFRERVKREFHFFPDIRMVFTSAITGKGLKDMFDQIVEIEDKITMRIKTRDLNDFFVETIRQAPAPVYGTRDVKFYYLTQTNQQPPAFIAFANQPLGVTPSYRRFLSKRMAERFGLEGIPIRIFVMAGRHGAGRGRMKEVEEELGVFDEQDAPVEGQDFAQEFEGLDIEKLESLDPLASDFEGESVDE